MRIVRVILVLAAVAAAFVAGRWYSARPAGPGKAQGRKILYWVDPMHPAYKSDKPGIAPDCGMKLEPVYADAPPPAAAGQHSADASTMPPGTVQVSAERQQLIGVKYGTAEQAPAGEVIRVVGKVAIDETRVSHVHSRTEGWIEKVHVNFVGDQVKQGQPMLTVYSPELLATQQEFLLAIKARAAMRHSSMAGVAGDSDALVSAARRRLQLWDLSDSQIDEVENTAKPIANVTLYAPASGYVITRNAFANQRVMPDTELYTVADLSRIWVLASAFEYQMPFLRVGQPATVSLPYAGGRTYSARVAYIQPQVDAATRTVQVRLELSNPGLTLRPEMYVNVELRSPQPDRLSVPSEAVMNTGLKQIVFVDRGNGYFEPREVETGETAGGRVRVLKGLEAGERVVTSGNFLISSESQLKSASEGMAAPESTGAHQHD